MTKIAVKRPVTTFMIILIFVAFGAMSLMNLQMDLLPNMNIPVAVVITSYVGASPDQVQNLITEPIEKAMATLDGLDTLTSQSSENSSVVIMQFDQKVDINFAAIDIREAVDMVKGSLPDDAGDPMVMKIDINSMSAIYISVSSMTDDLVELKSKVDDQIVTRLTRQAGVASVNVSGGREKEIRVDIIEDRLRGYGISESQISQLLGAENTSMPVGSITEAAKNLTIKIDGQFKDVEDIRNMPVKTARGSVVYIRDIANVYEQFADINSYSYLNGDNAVTMTIQKQSNANTVNVSRAVMGEIDKIIADYPELEIKVILDPADYISTSISSVANTAISGTLLAVIVLFVFLRNFRSTMVVAASIPLSIIVTFAFMYFANMTLNLMTLGGLTLGVGMLVDNSIVVLESIFQRMEKGESRSRSAINGAKEVAMSIIASTLTTIAVFAPVAWVGGMIAQVFNDLALSITFSLTASLLVALTFVPLACSLFLSPSMPPGEINPLTRFSQKCVGGIKSLASKSKRKPFGKITGFFTFFSVIFSVIVFPIRFILRWIARIIFIPVLCVLHLIFRVLGFVYKFFIHGFTKVMDVVGFGLDAMERGYSRALVFATNHHVFIMLLTVIFFVASMSSLTGVGMELLPSADQSQIDISVRLPAGAVLDRTKDITDQVLSRLDGIPEIKDVSTSMGSGGGMGMGMGGGSANSSSITVALYPMKERTRSSTEIADSIRDSMSDIAGAKITVEALTSMMGNTGGSGRDVQYNIKGDEVSELIKVSDDLIELLKDVPGLRDVSSTLATTVPQATIKVNRMKASAFGVSAQSVMGIVNTTISGSKATRLRSGGDEIQIRVGQENNRIASLEDLENLLIPSPTGVSVPLREIADIVITESPMSISRENQATYMTVYGSLDGRDLGSVTSDIDAKIASEYIFPYGVSIEKTGSQQQMDEEMRNLFTAFFIAIFVVYAIMAAEFESMYYPIIILGSVPLALSTGILGLFMMKQTLGITAALGLILLLGIVVNNAIVLVDYINLQRGRGLDLMEAVRTTGPLRLRAILMTTLTTVLGMLPMMLGAQEGSEMMQPLATVVVWGLSTSTLITLLVIPVLYLMAENARTKLLGERSRFRKIEEEA